MRLKSHKAGTSLTHPLGDSLFQAILCSTILIKSYQYLTYYGIGTGTNQALVSTIKIVYLKSANKSREGLNVYCLTCGTNYIGSVRVTDGCTEGSNEPSRGGLGG